MMYVNSGGACLETQNLRVILNMEKYWKYTIAKEFNIKDLFCAKNELLQMLCLFIQFCILLTDLLQHQRMNCYSKVCRIHEFLNENRACRNSSYFI